MGIRGKLIRSRISKNFLEKPKKTVFLAFFDILVNMTPEGRFQAKKQIFVIFRLKVGRKKDMIQ